MSTTSISSGGNEKVDVLTSLIYLLCQPELLKLLTKISYVPDADTTSSVLDNKVVWTPDWKIPADIVKPVVTNLDKINPITKAPYTKTVSVISDSETRLELEFTSQNKEAVNKILGDLKTTNAGLIASASPITTTTAEESTTTAKEDDDVVDTTPAAPPPPPPAEPPPPPPPPPPPAEPPPPPAEPPPPPAEPPPPPATPKKLNSNHVSVSHVFGAAESDTVKIPNGYKCVVQALTGQDIITGKNRNAVEQKCVELRAKIKSKLSDGPVVNNGTGTPISGGRRTKKFRRLNRIETKRLRMR